MVALACHPSRGVVRGRPGGAVSGVTALSLACASAWSFPIGFVIFFFSLVRIGPFGCQWSCGQKICCKQNRCCAYFAYLLSLDFSICFCQIQCWWSGNAGCRKTVVAVYSSQRSIY